MSHLFNGLYFSSATNTTIILESLDSSRQTGCVLREGQGLAPDGFLHTNPLSIRGVLCVWREMDGGMVRYRDRIRLMDRWMLAYLIDG